jgi:hypothetical protein
MIALGGDTPTMRTPVMTYLLIGLNVAVWLTVQGGGFDPNTLEWRRIGLSRFYG